VLDFPYGDGSGATLLGQVANSVVQLEVQADTESIPLPDNAVDVVVSFETIERVYDHARFLGEVKRVLRPAGRLIVSSAERDVYAPVGAPVTPLHVHELTREEFISVLSSQFAHMEMFGQRAVLGSALISESTCGRPKPLRTFERRDATHFESSLGLARPPYLVAVVSDAPLDDGPSSLYLDTTNLSELFARIANMESETKELNSQLMEERHHTQRVRDELAGCHVELSAKLQELERYNWQTLQRDEEHRALAAAYQRLWSEKVSLQTEREYLNGRLAAVLGSTSWGVTAPLRAGMQFAETILRRLT
jgi:hypothetical protein